MSNHLGGHYGHTAMPITTFDFIKEKFNIESAIDVGCGPGGMCRYMNYTGIYSVGIDGDKTIEKKDYIIYHDYTLGKINLNEYFDLAYSTEFLEHVEQQYIPNFMDTFQKCQYVFCTAAFPGQGGHHHVNEQLPDYWIKVFDEYDFDFDFGTMEEIKKTSYDKMIVRNGLFFKNRKTIQKNHKKNYNIEYNLLKKEINYYYDVLHKFNIQQTFNKWL